MNKKRVIVVCPGRGSYTRETKGYVSEFGGPAKEHIKWMDDQRVNDNCEPLTKLDSMPFRSKTHMTGENASALIYACSLSDFLSIDQRTRGGSKETDEKLFAVTPINFFEEVAVITVTPVK